LKSIIKISFILVFLGLFFLSYFIGLFSPLKSWKVSSGLLSLPVDFKVNYYMDKSIEIKWLGHGGFYVNWRGKKILLDPVLSSSVKIIPRQIQSFVEAEMLPKIDFLILSHMHYDHFDSATISKIKKVDKILLPKGSEVFLNNMFGTELIGLSKNETIKFDDLRITGVTAIHNGARNHPFSSKYFALGYIISDGENTLYFSGDTGYGEHFQEIKEKFRPTISILPIGSFEPYFVLKNYHLSPEDAVRAAKILGSKFNIPSHFGTFRLAFDSSGEALPRFLKASLDQGVESQLAEPYVP